MKKELEAIQVNVQNRVGDTHLQHIVGELKEWVRSLEDVNVWRRVYDFELNGWKKGIRDLKNPS